ncbi:hypothetical protein ALC56_07456 [Trachymyrmex septentrionalis]|uniref:Uncharacterized protein n=1 Tax=Trachymyrmex septentrionalis TaxID=34720 RepID=A0A195FCP8_9HYME|nr:hypothetical protein ALC56_07456 [Trachymyrmex septentrionalis]
MTERSDKKNISDGGTEVRTRRDEKRKAEERAVGAFPGHVGLMKIHGFSIGAIKSTTSLPLPCSSLRRNGNLELFDSESGPDLTLSPQTFTSTAEAFINDNSDSLGVPGDNDTGGGGEEEEEEEERDISKCKFCEDSSFLCSSLREQSDTL